MKSPLLLSIAIVAALLSFTQKDNSQAVNPVIGDISFVNKYGHQPDANTDDDLRIKTHLEYVENLLRQREVATLPTELQSKRKHLLDLLHTYWTAGVFPKNYDHAGQRKPCFIDKDGNICAVGYLIEQTAGRQAANEINSKHKYDELLAMNDKTIDGWIEGSGLTKEECAMIQPAYASNSLDPRYGVNTAIWCGVNLSLCVVNAIQLGKGNEGNTNGVIGLVSGMGQILYGAIKFEANTFGGTINETTNIISMINIGLGTTTMILSGVNLATNHKPKSKLTTWNIYSFPTQNQSTGLGFSVSRKF